MRLPLLLSAVAAVSGLAIPNTTNTTANASMNASQNTTTLENMTVKCQAGYASDETPLVSFAAEGKKWPYDHIMLCDTLHDLSECHEVCFHNEKNHYMSNDISRFPIGLSGLCQTLGTYLAETCEKPDLAKATCERIDAASAVLVWHAGSVPENGRTGISEQETEVRMEEMEFPEEPEVVEIPDMHEFEKDGEDWDFV